MALVAKTSNGKTAFALNVARNYSRVSGQPVLFFSLQMPITAIYERTYQLEMDVSGEEVKGEFRGLETEITRRIDLVFSRLPNLYIIPESGLTLKDIVAAVRLCEEGVSRKRTGLIVIDYLSLVRSDRDERDDYVRTARVARGMKDLAIE